MSQHNLCQVLYLKGLLFAGLLLHGVALADYQSGVTAYQQGQIERALEEWSKVLNSPQDTVHPAEMAETLYAVAMLYWMGQGLQQDTAKSAELLQHAAELNHAGAQSKLGYLYLIGQGVPQNGFAARKWLEMAAQQGDSDAQYNLGVIFRDGLGTEPDPNQAIKWFREAAANGDVYSSEVLAAYEREGTLQQRSAGMSQDDTSQPVQVASNEIAEDVIPSGPVEETFAETEPEVELMESTQAFEPAGTDLDEDWILSRDPEHYTIQVMALKNKENLLKLVEKHPDLQPMAVYRQGEAANPLYVLVQGDYSDVEGARAAAAVFPRTLSRPDKLWIRRFTMVQSLIDASAHARNE